MAKAVDHLWMLNHQDEELIFTIEKDEDANEIWRQLQEELEELVIEESEHGIRPNRTLRG